MSDTRVSVLTPPGTGAIATVAIAGPDAWDVVRTHFRPASGKPLPDSPKRHQFWFGNFTEPESPATGATAGDEVVLAVTQTEPELVVEVHCHGGRRVVRWVVDSVSEARQKEKGKRKKEDDHENGHPPSVAQNFFLSPFSFCLAGTFDPRALGPLAQAPTLRTAGILLDQLHGAYTQIEANPTPGALAELKRFAAVGRHLVEPWRVVVAGPPNVGKSSLINALAGYQRSVVSPTAGTTRDVVTVPLAFDGWPVELADTAGLRDSTEELEAAGIGLAKRSLVAADLIVWVLDGSDPSPVWPTESTEKPTIFVRNKSDLPDAWEPPPDRPVFRVSAATGTGISELASAIATRLVPDPPPPGAAVPFTPALADAILAK